MPVMTITSSIVAAVLAILGVPLGVALGLSCTVALLIFQPIPSFELIPQMMSVVTEDFVLTAVPLFVLAGVVMEKGGLGKRLISFINSLVGWAPGGLGVANIIGSMVFGGCSGSSLADTACLGSILIPRMVSEGYDRNYAGAVTATSSTLAVVIPPSILLIVWAVIAEQSAALLLVGGFLPGILITLLLLVPNYYISRKRNYGKVAKFSYKEFFKQLKPGIPPMLAPIIIIGGIMTGFFTPTEAAGVASIYALLVTIFIYRGLTINLLAEILVDAGKLTAGILFIVAASRLFTWIIAWEGVPRLVSNLLLSITHSPIVFLLLVNVLLIFAGMVLDVICALMVFTPLLLPAAIEIGVNPIHLGVIMVGNLAIGLVTPPFGACLFSTAAVGKMSIEGIVKESLPFYGALILSLLLYTYIPQIVLFLPNLLFGR